MQPSVARINDYGRYYKSALSPTLRSLGCRLVQWATRKYKGLRGHREERPNG